MRLIDADALVEYMDSRVFDLREMYGDYDHYTDGFDDALQVVEDAHIIDAVEVVRCKNCRYWDDERRCNGIKNGLVLEYTDEDDFCSYGERRDDNA